MTDKEQEQLAVSVWRHCGDFEPHVTHTYEVSEQGVPTHCLGTPWPSESED